MNLSPSRSRTLRTSFFLLMYGLSACAQTASVKPVMTTNSLLANPRPWCIGRFVIDRPARSELSSQSYEYWGDKIDITRNVSPGTFQHKADAREHELRTRKRTVSLDITDEMMRNGDNGIKEIAVPWLEKAVSPTSNSRLLIFKKNGKSDYSFTAEGYVLAGSTMLSMTSPVRPNDIQKSIQLTVDEYRNISYRDDWNVPTERGFCVNGALIGGPSRNSEVAKQTIVLQPGRPSALMIHMRDAVDVDHQSSLLKALPDLRKELSAQGYSSNVHVVRHGTRQIAGMDAEEVLFSIKEGQMQIFRFYLMASGNPNTVAQPHIEIQLILGSTVNSTMPVELASSPVDEAGAIQAWDTLLDSMRLRPGAM